MSYLGQVELKSSEIRRIDVTGSTSATHTLTWTPASEQSLIITINGIKQQNNYSIAGTTLTLDDALLSADKMEVIGILDIGEAVVPPDDSITNAMVKSDAAIDATKIADGTVTSAEFQYINSLSSNAQTQITARLPLTGGAMTGAITTNSTFDGVDVATRDGVLTSTTTTANAALPKAGGTMTGETIFADQLATKPLLKDYAESVSAIGTKTTAFDIDFEDGNVQSVTLSGSGTFNIGIVNALASHSNSITLIMTNPGAVTLTLLAGANGGGGNVVKWGGGTAPTWTASGVDVLTLTTFDGGTNFYGFQAADMKAPS